MLNRRMMLLSTIGNSKIEEPTIEPTLTYDYITDPNNWESGQYDPTTGEKVDHATRVRLKKPILYDMYKKQLYFSAQLTQSSIRINKHLGGRFIGYTSIGNNSTNTVSTQASEYITLTLIKDSGTSEAALASVLTIALFERQIKKVSEIDFADPEIYWFLSKWKQLSVGSTPASEYSNSCFLCKYLVELEEGKTLFQSSQPYSIWYARHLLSSGNAGDTGNGVSTGLGEGTKYLACFGMIRSAYNSLTVEEVKELIKQQVPLEVRED